MARKEVLLRYIQNAATRKTSCTKRRGSLLKKVEELNTLCNVTACIVVYGEDPNELPVHWPEDRARVEEVLWRYEACPDEKKRLITHQTFVDEMIEQYKAKLKKLLRTTIGYEIYNSMYLVYVDKLCHIELRMNKLQELRGITAQKIRDLLRKAEFMVENGDIPRPPSSHLPEFLLRLLRLGRLFYKGLLDNSTKEAIAIHPNPLVNEGSSRSGLTSGGTSVFPRGNLEVGGGSGIANDADSDHYAAFGYGTVIPTGPIIPYQARTVATGGGYLDDIPGIQNLISRGIVGGPEHTSEANKGSAPASTTTDDVEDATRLGGSGR